MKSEATSPKRPYERPILRRYRSPEGVVREYQTGTGAVNSIKCTNPDACDVQGAAAPPPWLIP
jgi:hypothetical protein